MAVRDHGEPGRQGRGYAGDAEGSSGARFSHPRGPAAAAGRRAASRGECVLICPDRRSGRSCIAGSPGFRAGGRRDGVSSRLIAGGSVSGGGSETTQMRRLSWVDVNDAVWRRTAIRG